MRTFYRQNIAKSITLILCAMLLVPAGLNLPVVAVDEVSDFRLVFAEPIDGSRYWLQPEEGSSFLFLQLNKSIDIDDSSTMSPSQFEYSYDNDDDDSISIEDVHFFADYPTIIILELSDSITQHEAANITIYENTFTSDEVPNPEMTILIMNDVFATQLRADMLGSNENEPITIQHVVKFIADDNADLNDDGITHPLEIKYLLKQIFFVPQQPL